MRGYYPNIVLGELTDVDDRGAQQLISHYGLAGEQHSSVYRPQSFGRSSCPPKGSTGLILSMGGERSRSVFLGGEHEEHRSRDLRDGEQKLYDASGNLIYFSGKDGLSVKSAEGNTMIETPKGNVTIDAKGHAYISSLEGHVYLGSKDGQGAVAVLTTAGPSTKVFAIL